MSAQPTSQPTPTTPPSDPVKKPNVLGIIALVAAVIGFIFACIPGALIVGWILLPIAFILSIVALFLKGTKWPAIVGLIVSIVGTIVGVIVFFAVVAGAVDNAFNQPSAPANQPAASSSPEPAGAQPEVDASSEYVVTIDGSTQSTDYEGKPVLIVDYTFTNNSNRDANFAFAVSAQAFQNDVELETAIVVDAVDSSAILKDIKPGASLPVQSAYVLSDTSDVTVEVKELISFDDTLIAQKVFSVQ